MPELPDLTLYVEALEHRVAGERLESVRLSSPFVLRSVDPPIAAAEGRRVTGVGRIGKRIVLSLESDLHLVLHLMIAGRLQWRTDGKQPSRKLCLAVFGFSRGRLLLTEASQKKRAALHLVKGEQALRSFDAGGIEVLQAERAAFDAALARESHTLKRALTDPRLFAGIGNAYSDEILHRARLSPLKLTGRLDAAERERLHAATRQVLSEWIERLRAETGTGFPTRVTAFREGMAVHGRFKQPCLVCGAPIQRIRYADNECNYCPVCQTGGRLLADRALSRLLRADWPRRVEELG